jgi:hypothetical protein
MTLCPHLSSSVDQAENTFYKGYLLLHYQTYYT